MIDTPQDAARERSRLSRALRDSIEEMRTAGLARAEAEHAYDFEYSKALLKASASSADKRKAEALMETEKLYRDLLVKQVGETYWKTRVNGIRSDLSAFLTVVSALKEEFHEVHRGPS